jgi:hypothetical protein
MAETLYATAVATPTTPVAGSDSAAVTLITRIVPYTGYQKIRVSGLVKVVEVVSTSVAQAAPIAVNIGAQSLSITNVTAAVADTNFIPFVFEVNAAQGATVSVTVPTLAGADTATVYQIISFLVEGI